MNAEKTLGQLLTEREKNPPNALKGWMGYVMQMDSCIRGTRRMLAEANIDADVLNMVILSQGDQELFDAKLAEAMGEVKMESESSGWSVDRAVIEVAAHSIAEFIKKMVDQSRESAKGVFEG